jgi:hypothetical protein
MNVFGLLGSSINLSIYLSHLTLSHLNIYCSTFNNSRINEKPTLFTGLHWVKGVGLYTKCNLSDYVVVIYHSVNTFTVPREYLKSFHLNNRGQRSKRCFASVLSCHIVAIFNFAEKVAKERVHIPPISVIIQNLRLCTERCYCCLHFTGLHIN